MLSEDAGSIKSGAFRAVVPGAYKAFRAAGDLLQPPLNPLYASPVCSPEAGRNSGGRIISISVDHVRCVSIGA